MLKCLEPRTNGLDAVFSDMAGMCAGRLKGEPEDLVYISSMSSNVVRSFNPASGEVKLVLGNGTRGDHTQGMLEDPFGLAIDSQNRLIVSCLEGYTIVRYDPSAEPNRQVWRATLAFVPNQLFVSLRGDLLDSCHL